MDAGLVCHGAQLQAEGLPMGGLQAHKKVADSVILLGTPAINGPAHPNGWSCVLHMRFVGIFAQGKAPRENGLSQIGRVVTVQVYSPGLETCICITY